MQRAFSAEFPNDNDELHLGTIWMSVEPCGRAEAHFAPAASEPDDATPIEATLEPTSPEPIEEPNEETFDEPIRDEEPTEPIEIVESIPMGEPDEVVPVPLESTVVLSSRAAEEIAAGIVIPPPAPVPVVEASVEESLVALEAEPHVAQESPADAPVALDPYLSLLETLSSVASTVGASLAASSIEAQLAGDPVARAWRAILRGESEDFGACPTTLDEWAGATLAALIGAPQKSAQLRRELRARGVAAFGLVEAA